MNVTCPECRATLEPDEIDRVRRECPLCSASLADLDLSAIEDQLGDESDDVIAGHTQPVSESPSPAEATTGQRVEIIERSADRLVAHLPPTTRGSGGIGLFAVVWNGFMVFFTAIVSATFFKQRGNIEIIPVLFLIVFWLVGLGLIVGWVRMRFTRLYLLLEKDRLVVQRKLFGTKNRELLLTPASKATLEESYAVNDVPVYSVTVHGDGRQEAFGTGLESVDKEFLANEINAFLGVTATALIPSKSDVVCSHCGVNLGPVSANPTAGGQLCPVCRQQASESASGTLWPPLRAGNTEELPTGLIVDESEPDHIVLRYPLFPPSRIVTGFQIVFIVVAVIWMTGVLFTFGRALPQDGAGLQMTFTILMGAFFLFPAMGMILMAQAISRGKITISLAADWVQMNWGWGLVAIQKRFLPETITECRIIRSIPPSTQGTNVRRASASPVAFAAIRAGGTPYPLITFHGIEYGQKVIRLVRTYLQDLTGRSLPD